ncbi:MAG: hypothetical protein ABIK37_04940 [candidate division WOR-3 bacterium]
MAKIVKAKAARASQVVEALAGGGVIVPVSSGYGVLGFDRGELDRRVGRTFRPAADLPSLESGLRAKTERLLELGAAVIADSSGAGYLLLQEEPGRSAVAAAGRPVWLAVPDDVSGLPELLDELGDWAVLAVSRDGPPGPGPAVVDLRQEPAVVDRRGTPAILELERELGGLVRLGPDVFFSVLVVCTGNSCRSPMAAGMLSRMLSGERVLVGSAGTDAPEGSPATKFAVEVAAEMGADITAHRAQQLSLEMIEAADLILVMERYHEEWVVARAPDARSRVRFIAGYPQGGGEVADPVGRSLEFYRETALLMKAGLMRVAAEVKRRLQ